MKFLIIVGLVPMLFVTYQHAQANATPQPLPASQTWTATSQLFTANDWSAVPGFLGYRGDDLTTTIGADPQLVVADGTGTPLNVLVNQTNPNSNSSGGLAEFELTDPAVAMQGSGTADAPFLLLNLNTTARQNIRVEYKLRDLDGSGDDAIQPMALQFRVGGTGVFTNIPAAFVADATTAGTALQVTSVNIVLPPAANNVPLVQIRWITVNATGSDEWVGIDDISVTGDGLNPALPSISLNDVTVTEGNSGTVTATVTVSLSMPAPVGGVGFRVDTADLSATQPDDYTAISNSVRTIAEGATSAQIVLSVNGDLAIEANETFRVALTDISNANVPPGPAIVTIRNDDFARKEIFEVQGSGAVTPFLNQTFVFENNVVTARSSNGFFVQTPDVRADASGDTSNALFVFTGSAPSVAVGDAITFTGTVIEFGNLTEISPPPIGTAVLSSGNPLPSAVALNGSRPSPNPAMPSCAIEFECLENMRVEVATGVVTEGNTRRIPTPTVNPPIEAFAEFFATASGVRAFREPGLKFPGQVGLPVWDGNPELFKVDADRLGQPNQILAAGSTFTASGILGFEFGFYELWPTSIVANPAVLPRPTRAPTATEFRVGAYNIFRSFDTVDDPLTDDDVITAPEFARRVERHALYILGQLRAPEIIGVAEVENLVVLDAIADYIRANTTPQISYTSRLLRGNDIGGINVGFLVRSDITLESFAQLRKDEQFEFPTGTFATLNDRPMIRLEASRGAFRIAVFMNHTRSFGSIESPTDGARVRAKRLAQAQSVAAEVDSYQDANPDRVIAVVGDLNAYEFTDGYVDVVNQIAGTAVPGDNLLSGPNLTTPSLFIATKQVPAAERYSYNFAGSAQTIDHALYNQFARGHFRGVEYGRANADAPIEFYNSLGSILRSSDHDGLVLYLDADVIYGGGFEAP